MDKQKTGVMIREARIAKNYTQSELGNLIGVSNKAVSRWENGELLHNLITFEEVWKCLLTNICTITIEMVIAIIIGISLTRKKQ